MAINSTRLRSITAGNKQELEQAVNSLPFKIEIKTIQPTSSPKGGWIVYFILPEVDSIEFKSLDLT